jgi:hypothetical protein
VRRAQCSDDIDAFGVANFFGTGAARLIGVATDRCDDMRAARARHLHHVAADPSGRAHDNEALASGDA